MNKVKKLSTVLLVLSLFVSSVHCGDIALIKAINKGRFYSIKSAIEQGANPNCKVGQDPALIFAIRCLVDEIQKETVSIPAEIKRFIVGVLLLTPAAVAIVLGGAGIATENPGISAAVALLAVALPIITLLCIAVGLIGGVKVCRAAWRVLLNKPLQSAKKVVNVYCRNKVIDNLLQEDTLDATAHNTQDQTALDVVRVYSLEDALHSNMSYVEEMLLARTSQK